MLLPSAFACDPSQPSTPKTRFQSRMLFASPPLSPPPSSSSTSTPPALNNLFSTCRALHSMLQPSPIPSQLPSPPTQHAEMPTLSSPHKLRLRTRNTDTQGLTPRKRITKRGPSNTAPRGINKRRRESAENREEQEQEQVESEEQWTSRNKTFQENRPSTPKRQRIAPEVLPLGLERGDFHTLHLQQQPEFNFSVLQSIEPPQTQTQSDRENEEDKEWSTEEDRILVELVLEKLKLSKSDWQDCARSLGKDRGSVGKRWRSLMGNGDVGLKTRSSGRRAKLHGTWR